MRPICRILTDRHWRRNRQTSMLGPWFEPGITTLDPVRPPRVPVCIGELLNDDASLHYTGGSLRANEFIQSPRLSTSLTVSHTSHNSSILN